jgi:hypothetical protein
LSRACPLKSGKQAFHKHCIARDKEAAAGAGGKLSVSPCSKAYWHQVSMEWEAFSDAEKQDIAFDCVPLDA